MFTGSSNHIFAPCSPAPPEGATKTKEAEVKPEIILTVRPLAQTPHLSIPSSSFTSVYTSAISLHDQQVALFLTANT